MKAAINPKYEAYRHFLLAIPKIFTSEGTTLNRGRNEIKLLEAADGHRFVVKKYKKPNFPSQLRHLFTGINKAQKARKYAHIFLNKGFDTPAPVAVITDCQPLLHSLYFVSEVADGSPLTDEMIKTDAGLANDLARQLVAMHAAGVMHGDLNLGNIMGHHAHGRWLFTFIDINRSRVRSNPSIRECALCMMRISHDRKVLSIISQAYARQRNWDAQQYDALVQKMLDRFEAKKRFLKKFKRK